MNTLTHRSVQEIFDIVIAEGCYGVAEYYSGESEYEDHYDWSKDVRDFMCGALSVAYRRGLITYTESDYAKGLIQQYLRNSGRSYLGSALMESNLPNDFNARLAIYKDWANRPNLVHMEDSVLVKINGK